MHLDIIALNLFRSLRLPWRRKANQERSVLFGSINYLNLLPFQIFMKQKLKNTRAKQAMIWKRSTPSEMNSLFHKHKIDAAFISSVTTRKSSCMDLGIVADGEVLSVILIPGKKVDDRESATSNILARVLDLEGEVIIGDKALTLKRQDRKSLDLAAEWKKSTKLPFVFARLCYNEKKRLISKLAKEFSKRKHKIPVYYLKKAAHNGNITEKELLDYLSRISYDLGWREKKSLYIFLKKSRSIAPKARRYNKKIG